MKRIRTVFALLFLITATGCDAMSSADNGTDGTNLRALSDEEARLVEADNAFGLHLFRTVSGEDNEENVFISPLSVSMALGMTLNGAGGETREEMRRTLSLAGLSTADINRSYGRLLELLRGLDSEVQLEIANSIWHREGFEVRPDFLSVNEQFFGASVRALDFSRPDAVETINSWVDVRTHGKIGEIVDQISPESMLFLINAVYFDGAWSHAFDTDLTQERPFTRHDGSLSNVPMMSLEADLPYLVTEDFQAVDLPYGDSLYTMTVILPNEETDVHDVVKGLDAAAWNDYLSKLRTRDVNLRLPRFDMSYEIKLKDILSAMGMESAFDPDRADLTGIHAERNLYVSEVVHKAFIQVDEEGTEAAAATSVGIEITSVTGPYMYVNRPFIYVLRERHSGTILFVGKVLSL